MKVIDCPQCGSDNIEKSSYSAEYMSSTRWSCEDCDWSYKQGRGMGTGSDNSGVHPRNAGPDDGQSTLVQTGQWCSNCESCVVSEHGCHAEEHVEPGGRVSKESVIDSLNEWHYRPEEELAYAIDKGDLTLTPDFETVMYETVESREVWVDTVTKLVNQLDDDIDRKHGYGVYVTDVTSEMDCSDDAERAVVEQALDNAARSGRITSHKYGYEP